MKEAELRKAIRDLGYMCDIERETGQSVWNYKRALANMREAELRKLIRDVARQKYGLLVKDISMSGPVPQQLVGLPDHLIWGPNRFLTIEVKIEGGELRDAQWDFIEAVTPYIGQNVMHVVCFCIEQAEMWLEWCASGGWPGNEEEPF